MCARSWTRGCPRIRIRMGDSANCWRHAPPTLLAESRPRAIWRRQHARAPALACQLTPLSLASAHLYDYSPFVSVWRARLLAPLVGAGQVALVLAPIEPLDWRAPGPGLVRVLAGPLWVRSGLLLGAGLPAHWCAAGRLSGGLGVSGLLLVVAKL